ncbi:hypothetical protein E2C01_036513 [Portunus trituberculatus]|uniref:Uncharacterized protein n=1 Tax=Portunus trituberculatus TaxID=210409 RepID=A0A5B7F8X3_PORTR|nr:hypothetical protein [Portunus trituberculatus]
MACDMEYFIALIHCCVEESSVFCVMSGLVFLKWLLPEIFPSLLYVCYM